MEILVYLTCALIGIFIGYLIGRNRKREHELDAQVKVLESRIASLNEQAARDKEDWESRTSRSRLEWQEHMQELLDARQKACDDMISAQEKRHEEAFSAQQAKFDETIAKVTAQMKSATEDMLKRRQEEFAMSSNTSLGQIVNPLKETIDSMKEAMKENTIKQTSISSEIKIQAENMMRQSAAAKESADELTRVFRHAGRVQGNWGEIILDELLESQGLTKGVHYDLQSSIRDSAGDLVRTDEERSMRPDVILHLDQKRDVIIDSKVSLTAFMDYVNADDEETRIKYLKAHIESIQKHIKELSCKDYSSYVRPPKVRMDYVIMFVPNTGALWTAVNAQPDLWRNAMDRNVYIADEQTLFAALRIISMTWTQIAQAQNHEKVYELANEMMDRVGQFMDRYKAIGKSLENASKAYEAADKKLQPSGQSIIQTCVKLQKLGARQSARNPIPLLEDSPSTDDGFEKNESVSDDNEN